MLGFLLLATTTRRLETGIKVKQLGDCVLPLGLLLCDLVGVIMKVGLMGLVVLLLPLVLIPLFVLVLGVVIRVLEDFRSLCLLLLFTLRCGLRGSPLGGWLACRLSQRSKLGLECLEATTVSNWLLYKPRT